jgi:hypothetical protein
MKVPASRYLVAVVSLLFTYLFYFEFLPPFHSVHIPSDLEIYHYPLFDYAFQRLRNGEFPLWDPSVYSGMSFVTSIPASLFYPPTWLMFLLRMNSERLSFQAMEDLMLAHVWLAFFLCYLWLRGKRLHELAAILGAGVFAYSGFMCTWVQHLGTAGGFAWMPLGLWGIDQAVERTSWRPLWKLAVASAMCFLAGYPPMWFVFAFLMGVYALTQGLKVVPGTVAALVFSLAMVAVQILPTAEATRLRLPELRYAGTHDPVMLLAFLLPGYVDFSVGAPPPDNVFANYFYLGVPALFAMLLLWRRRPRGVLPPVVLLVASALMVTNPLNVIGSLVGMSVLLQDICRDQNFLGGVTLAVALLTGVVLDDFLRRNDRPIASWMTWASASGMACWIAFDLFRWRGAGFPVGWSGWFDVAIPLALFAAGIAVVRGQKGTLRVWSAAVLLLFAGVNYKVMGTNRRFNTLPGTGQSYYSNSFVAMDPVAYRELREHSQQRILLDQTGPMPALLRHVGLLTPQGFDPFLSIPYRRFLQPHAHFSTDRLFEIEPSDYAALQALAVRYFISADAGPMQPKLLADPRFRLVGSNQFFYQVFVYLDARPTHQWDSAGSATPISWTPERREFSVISPQGGPLHLSEQRHPGWTVSVDGKTQLPDPWNEAFQSVNVPAGEHRVVFQFWPNWLITGAAISVTAWLALFWFMATAPARSRE